MLPRIEKSKWKFRQRDRDIGSGLSSAPFLGADSGHGSNIRSGEEGQLKRREFLASSLAAPVCAVGSSSRTPGLAGLFLNLAFPSRKTSRPRNYKFDKKISRDVLDNYLSRAISMQGMLNGEGNLDDNLRMLKHIGAKYIGRSVCLWGHESDLFKNLQIARQQVPQARASDPDMILEACIFEIVTTEVEQVPVPDWAFKALGLPVEKRNFRYEAILYPPAQRWRSWGKNGGIPDVSQTETQLWFYFLAKSYIDLGFEGIHWGQVELMNHNDPHLDHYSHVFAMARAYARKHARRGMLLCNAHVPSGGLVRDGRLLLDFHARPLRIKEIPGRPEEAKLQVGYLNSIYCRSKGGITYSGWKCEHLPYLVEFDNFGVTNHPGKAVPTGDGIWVWGYDEITWFAHQSKEYRHQWLHYAWDWVRRTDPNGYVEMPGSRTLASPLDHMKWYHANNPSPAVPNGFGDEDTIRSIWDAGTTT
jgi:hypothetical protein